MNHKEETKVIGGSDTSSLKKKNFRTIATRLGLGILGITGAAAIAETLTSMTEDDHKPQNHDQAPSTTDSAPVAHLQSPVIVIHDEAPHAAHVTNEMTFKDAFAVAREEVGPGGVFSWHNKLFNTYTSNEFDVMSHDQKHDFLHSLGNLHAEPSNIGAHEVDIVSIDHGDTTVPVAEQAPTEHTETPAVHDNVEHLIKEEDIDNGDGKKMHMGVFSMNGEHIIKLDRDGDGHYDFILTKHEDGSAHLSNTLTGEEVDLTEDELKEIFHTNDAFENNHDNGIDQNTIAPQETHQDDHHPTDSTHHVDHGSGDFDPNANMDNFDN